MARRDRRRAEAGALVVSILAHLVIFVILAREAAPSLRLPATSEPDFQVQLVTSPPTPASAPAPLSTPRPSRRPPRREARPQPARPAPVPRPSPAPPPRAIAARPAPPRAPPAPAAAPSRTVANTPAAGAAAGRPATSGGGAPAAHGRWTVEGEDGQDGVRKFLHATVGCQHADYVKLSADEQADCDRKVGEEARKYLDKQLVDPQKRAAFIAAAEAQERQRANRTGPVQDVLGPCTGNSNLGGGCLKDPSRHPDPFDSPRP